MMPLSEVRTAGYITAFKLFGAAAGNIHIQVMLGFVLVLSLDTITTTIFSGNHPIFKLSINSVLLIDYEN